MVVVRMPRPRMCINATALVLLCTVLGGTLIACAQVIQPPSPQSTPETRPAESVKPRKDPVAVHCRRLSGPIWAASWSDVPDDVRHITPMIRVRSTASPEKAAQESVSRPAGRAVMLVLGPERAMATNPADHVRTSDGKRTHISGPWLDEGIRNVRRTMQRFFTQYHRAGGRLDWLVLDFEIGRSNWSYDARVRKQHMQAVLADPRGDQIRDELLRRGLTDEGIANIHDAHWSRPRYTLGGTDLSDELQRHNPPYIVWNALMSERLAESLHEAVFEPARDFYRDVQGSNYNYCILSPENIVPEINGHLQYTNGRFGTHGARSFYGVINNLSRVRTADGSPYGEAPFDVLRWQVNTLRAIQRSSNRPFQAWVSNKSYRSSRFKDNGYYEELIYHLALGETENFLYWHSTGREGVTSIHAQQARILDQCLNELNRWFDGRPRRSVSHAEVPWDSSLVVSGMHLGEESILWRITVPPGTKAVTVEPPGETLQLSDGQVGCWFESPAGVPAPKFIPVNR